MKYSRLWLVATIFAIVLIIGFVFSVPHTRDVGKVAAPQNVVVVVPSVQVHDAFKKGVHTITGSIEAPNACTTVSATATDVGTASSTESILIAIEMPEDTGICLQEPVRVNFSTTLSAVAGLPIQATVNGKVATTTQS